MARYVQDKLWEFRIAVVPKINENQIRLLTEFLADIDPYLPVCFLAFRPNFVLENHPGASTHLMRTCLDMAKSCGLKNVTYAGQPDIPGRSIDENNIIPVNYSKETLLANTYALKSGCQTFPRNCKDCSYNQDCKIKQYTPVRQT